MESKDRKTRAEALFDEEIVGNSPESKVLKRAVRRLSKIDSHLLILGETGTGKEFIARQIFVNSPRKNRNFVKVNCCAIGSTIDRKDIFGEETKEEEAVKRTIGLLEKANKGVLFLDRIADLAPSFQNELFQVINEQKFRRVGGEENINLDIRIISTIDRDLTEDIESGRFLKDLYYHLNALQLHIPPLRERKQDIPEFFIYFLKKDCAEHDKEVPAIPSEIFESILEYDWKGNVRELENCVQNMVMMSPEGELSPEFLPFEIKRHPFDFLELKNLKGTVAEVESYLIRKALRKFSGHQIKAAKLLGVPEATLRFKMKKYGIPKD